MNPRTQPTGLQAQNEYIAKNSSARQPRTLRAVLLGVLIGFGAAIALRAAVGHPAPPAALPGATPDVEAAFQRGLARANEPVTTYSPIEWRCTK